MDEAWHGEIADRQPALYAIIGAADLAHGKNMKSYLIMMAVRLLEMHRLLKPTGSLYLHCDPTASHYLKTLLDVVFGAGRFRNEIVWERTKPKGLMTRRYPTNHDVVLAYERTDQAFWNPDEVFVPYTPDNLDEKTLLKYSQQDPDGRRYQFTSLLNPNSNRPNLTYELLGITRVWRWTQERMQAEYARGRVVQTAPDRAPRYKRYLDEQRGRPFTDVWTGVVRSAREDIRYPTQKPLALLDRIIRAASKENDVVLDPFCGCATTLVAADRLNRQWAGIDLSPLAARLVLKRLRDDRGPLFDDVIHREDMPRRTDLGELPNYRTHKHTLYGRQEGICAGCRILFPFRNLTVDHIIPQTKGGSDHLDNLQLLCGACNSMKGAGTQEQLIVRLTEQGIRQ